MGQARRSKQVDGKRFAWVDALAGDRLAQRTRDYLYPASRITISHTIKHFLPFQEQRTVTEAGSGKGSEGSVRTANLQQVSSRPKLVPC